ncbi:MAG: hypothetical protein JNK87_36250 [Bryobacterales bacterium]|nr:hypothetical protein [Bryobacterales bacterium]
MRRDINQLLEDARERLPADLLALLLQLSTAERNEASNIADDIRYSFVSGYAQRRR